MQQINITGTMAYIAMDLQTINPPPTRSGNFNYAGHTHALQSFYAF